MEYNNKDLYKNGLNYGLILGLAFIVFTMMLAFLKIFNQNYTLIANVLIASVAVYFGNVNLRDKMQSGYISYSRSLGSGTFIGLVAGVILGVFIYVFYSMISPESLQAIYEVQEQQMLQQGLPEGQLDMVRNIRERFMTPGFMAFGTVLSLTFWCFIVSLVISSFVKHNLEDEY